MGRFLGKSNSPKDEAGEGKHEELESGGSEFAKKDLYKKGVNQMASEKLQEAIRSFDLALRIDRNYVDAWIKKEIGRASCRERV